MDRLMEKDIKIGDTVALPSITDELFKVIDSEERGQCLYTKVDTFEAYIGLKEAESYGMIKVYE